MRRILAITIVLAALLGAVALGQPSRRGDAQDQTDERLAALETRVTKQSKSISKLGDEIDALQTQVAGLESGSSGAASAEATPADATEPAEAAEPTVAPTKAASGPAGTFANPVPVGDEVTLPGDWTVKVVDVVPDGTEQVMSENQFNDPPAEGRQFFLVRLAMTNNSSAPSSYRSVARFSAVGKSAVAYESFDAYCGVVPEELPDAEVFPGGSIEGYVCWSIDSGDADSLVMFADSSVTFDQDDRVYFSLQK